MVNLVVIPLVISLAMFSFEGDDKHERKNVEARLEVAYVKASGNTEAETFSGKVYLSMRTGRNILFFKISGLKTTTKSEKSASKLFSEARWEYSLNDNLFVFNNMNISRDRLSGYDFRISVGPGVGYGFSTAGDHQIKGYVSMVYSYDNLSVGETETDGYGALRAAVEYSWDVSSNLKIKNATDYHQSAEDAAKYYLNTEFATEVRINKHLALGVSCALNYQHEVPFEGIENLDSLLLTSLIIDL